jgi:hypothetical protein
VTIITDHSPWLIVLCLVAGLLISAALYFRNTADSFPRPLKIFLAGLRFILITLLGILLLGPLLHSLNRHIEEPLLIFVQDNSSSLVLGADSAYYKEVYPDELQDFIFQAQRKFDTRQYAFGQSFRRLGEYDFKDAFTNISDVFSGIEALYSNRNIGAVILASDGIYNRGMNPYYSAQRIPFPVYTLALGDTTMYRDVLLNRVNHNRITYLENRFPVEIVTEARQSQGLTSRLTIHHKNEIVYSRNITFDSSHHFETLLVELEAKEPGMQRYTVSLSALEAEKNLQNNSQEFFIEVIDSQQKVLILGNSPHPDLGALKLSLEENQNYEVEVALAADFKGSPEAYNLVILHQLPSLQHNMESFLARSREAEVPKLFILGNQTNLNIFNGLQAGVVIQQRSSEFTEALPDINSSFSIFSLEPDLIETVRHLPPLYVPFASYQVGSGTQVLFQQKIGAVSTEQPLVMLSQSASIKTGVIAGEGIWRWRLHNFARQGDHRSFDEMFSRIVQYLSLKEDKTQFRVKSQQFLNESDPLIFDAELYNPSYELVNEPEVELTIVDDQGVSYPYTMGRTSNAYRLDAGMFPAGSYSWTASTSLGGERFSASGIFSVSALNIEGMHTVADHGLLYQISSGSGGELFYPGQWEELLQRITQREDIKPVLFARSNFQEAINLKLLFFLLILLLSLEWFLRKRSGSY